MSNRVVKPEQQTPAPQLNLDSAKPDTKVADAENKPNQATADSQAKLPNTGTKMITNSRLQELVPLALLGLGFLLKKKKEN